MGNDVFEEKIRKENFGHLKKYWHFEIFLKIICQLYWPFLFFLEATPKGASFGIK